MVRRFLLTGVFVDQQSPPQQGELWFPDSDIRGFGLRLWAGPNGGGAAYCLRCKCATGRWTRRQFKARPDAINSADRVFSTSFVEPVTLGDWLPYARDWARVEFVHLAGGKTESEKDDIARSERRAKMRATALVDVLRRYLSDGKGATFKDGYRDRMTIAINEFLSPEMGRTPLGEVTAEMLTVDLLQPGRSWRAATDLRSFIAKVATSEFTAYAAPQLASKTEGDFYWMRARAVWGPGLETERQRMEPLVGPVRKLLDQQAIDSVSAAFLRVYLATGAKQRPLMTIRWTQIVDGHFYPYLPDSRTSWLWARERISPDLESFLLRYRTMLAKKFGDQDLIFPSRQRDGSLRPITSVQRFWRTLVSGLEDPSLRDGGVSLARFAATVTPRNTPAHLMNHNLMIYWIHQSYFSKGEAEIRAKLSKKPRVASVSH